MACNVPRVTNILSEDLDILYFLLTLRGFLDLANTIIVLKMLGQSIHFRSWRYHDVESLMARRALSTTSRP